MGQDGDTICMYVYMMFAMCFLLYCHVLVPSTQLYIYIYNVSVCYICWDQNFLV